ncbi:oligoribonuclease [Geobacillus sp. 46C-IIa]|uniref:DHH family phosphoesterase n=1 Tax=Geobacillus sp. 46C-IIa TaxID=1963025 RepID=UPI0009C088F5|nr:oligoribonuclease [Geobacillus sp. 46C-IIa]OQP07152.1 oligoribonuclease [Geobacillus sp. 46C-IIa]QNU29477.1 oligoribonuclease [Geobacillus sp. 46C-IIa]
MIKLFTDSDLDGIGCGLLAKLAFTEVNISFCSYRNLDERVARFLQGEEAESAMLFITDLAVGKDVEEQLAERAKRGGHVQVVDHHVTALHFNNYPWGWVVPADDNGKKTCATSLFYDYLVREGKLTQSDSLATFVELVRQYDTWEWEENGNLQAKRLNDLLTILGLDGFWETMSERLSSGEPFALTETEELLLDMEEKKIQRYIRQKQKQLVQRSLGGYCIGVVFAERHLSELGNALSKRYPHLDLIAMVNMGTKHIGFRTIHDDVNVAEFARQFGGGGHPKASGCFVDDTTFPLFVIETFPLLPVYGDAEQNQLNKRDEAEGAFWTNHHGQWWLSRRTEQGWSLHADGGETRTFPEEAAGERWLKRQFAAGLAHDAAVLEFLSARLGRDKDAIQADYPAAVKQYKQQTGIER